MTHTTQLIGITGNIATGKSVVRRMLANCGALGIDADLLAHRSMYPGGAAYQAVIETFGEHILTEGGQISRPQLAQIVFQHPDQLSLLEALVHPAVIQATLARIHHTDQPLAAVEAVKLLEAGMDAICTAIWVSHASEAVQMERLLHTRNMSEPDARARMAQQPSHTAHLAQADVIIDTEGSFESTWQQVKWALHDTIQIEIEAPLPVEPGWHWQPAGKLPKERLAAFWKAHSGDSADALFENLGMRMVLPILKGETLKALVLWDSWNFTATLQRVITADRANLPAGVVLKAFEAQALTQQCEILLVSPVTACEHNLDMSGFQQYLEHSTYPAWQQACGKVTEDSSPPWIKVLAQPFEPDATVSTV